MENTHEAIISEEVFQKVQELIASRRRKRRNGTTQIFAGLIKCADCGWSLAYGENKQNKNPYGYYHCNKNGQGLRQCSMHYIRYDVLYAYVLALLQYWSRPVSYTHLDVYKRQGFPPLKPSVLPRRKRTSAAGKRLSSSILFQWELRILSVTEKRPLLL